MIRKVNKKVTCSIDNWGNPLDYIIQVESDDLVELLNSVTNKGYKIGKFFQRMNSGNDGYLSLKSDRGQVFITSEKRGTSLFYRLHYLVNLEELNNISPYS